MDRESILKMTAGPELDRLITEHIMGGTDKCRYPLYSKDIQQAWNILRLIRSKGYLISFKLMPPEGSFTIDGSRSEYDAPSPDRKVFKGETVIEIVSMGKRPHKTIFAHGRYAPDVICKGALLLHLEGGLDGFDRFDDDDGD